MNEYLSTILLFVKKCHSRRLLTIIGNYIWKAIFVFLSITLVLQIVFAIFPLTFFPLVWDIITILLIVFIAGVIVYTLLIRPPSLLSTARIIEKKSSITHPLLSLSLEFSNSFNPQNEFYEEIWRRGANQVSLISKVNYYSLNIKKIFSLLLIITSTLVFSFVFKPSLVNYWYLPLLDMSSSSFTVYPGSVSIPKFSSIELKLIPHGISAPSAEVVFADITKNNKITKIIRPNKDGTFSYFLDSIDNTLTYYFVCNTRSTPPETIHVVPKPYLSSLQIELIPPEYSNTKSEKLPYGDGNFTALVGTKAKFYLESPHLKKATIMYGSDTIKLDSKKESATGVLIVKESGEYTISLEDTFSQKTNAAATFYIQTILDELPAVAFVKPAANKSLEPAQIETLLVECTDDFGIRKLEIFYFKNRQEKPSKIDLSPEEPVTFYQKFFIWEIFKLSLYPNDTIYYWARVFDSKIPLKQSATTDTFWFRLPSLEEIHRKVVRREEEAENSLRDVVKGQKEFMRNLDNIKEELINNNKSQWEREQIAKKLENIVSEQIDSLRVSIKKLEENIEQLNKEGNLGEEVLRKMEEVQKSIQELIDMYGDSLFFKRDNNDELSLNDMKKSIDRMREILPELNERLENTLKYLETLKRDREFAELAMKAEKLAQEQLLLTQDREEKLSTLSQKEKNLLERVEELTKEIKSKDGAADSSLQKTDSLRENMARELSEGSMPSSSNMNRMSAQLADLASELKQKMSSYFYEQLEILKKALFEIASNTLELIDWQSGLKRNESDTDEELLKKVKKQQLINETVQYLKKSVDSLALLPLSVRKVFNADINEIRNATKTLINVLGEGGNINIASEDSERAMKKFASDVLEFVNQMDRQQSNGQCNSGSAYSLREALRRLSGKQAAINSATAELLKELLKGSGGKRGREGKGKEEGGGSGTSNEKARKEAQVAQEKLAEELKKLGEKFGGVSSEEMKRRVEELEKEARQISQMLQEPREEVTERQDRFLSRMLQAALSLHREEDKKEERKSTTASTIFYIPKNIKLDTILINKQDAFYLQRKKAIEEGNYPNSYRAIINTYFDSLRSVFIEIGEER